MIHNHYLLWTYYQRFVQIISLRKEKYALQCERDDVRRTIAADIADLL